METENIEKLSNLKKIIDFAFCSIIPLIGLFIYVGIVSNSLTILVLAFDYGFSFIVQLFFFISIRAIIKSNIMKFPYGTGKLENFSGLLYGTLSLPTASFFVYSAIERFFLHPSEISLGIVQLPMIPSVIRSLILYFWITRLRKRMDSPMIRSYHVNFKISALSDTSVVAIIALAYGLHLWQPSWWSFPYYVDATAAVGIASYWLYSAVRLVNDNFRVLSDFPLKESDQLKILRTLVNENENYVNIGNIYTRLSGNTRFIEIELYLPNDAKLEEIMTMRDRMEKQLTEHFPDLHFSLIPLVAK